MSRIGRIVCILCVMALLVAPMGCRRRKSSAQTERERTYAEAPHETMDSVPIPPGIFKLEAEHEVRAVGTLVFKNVEGGTWVLVDKLPRENKPNAKVVVVISNPMEITEYLHTVDTSSPVTGNKGEIRRIDDLAGGYLAFDGKLLKGASTRMGGPEIDAQDVHLVPPTRSAPPAGLTEAELPE